MPETKVQPEFSSALDVEAKGLLCVCGPLAGRLHHWDGARDARIVVTDKDRAWIKHVYLYHRFALEAGKEVVGYAEFWAYAGPEGL